MDKTKLFLLGFGIVLISILVGFAAIEFLNDELLKITSAFALAGTTVGGAYMGATSPQQVLEIFRIKP